MSQEKPRKGAAQVAPVNPQQQLLYLLVFVAGATTLAMEFVSQRMLATYWGGGLAVWGSTISVTLLALALGYSVGGRLADRYSNVFLIGLNTSLGIFAILINALIGTKLLSLLQTILPGTRSGSLLGALIIICPAVIALSTLGPIIIRMLSVSLDRAGSLAGDVYALSTFGSIAGTLLTAFYLVDLLETSAILSVSAAFLLFFLAISLLRLGRYTPLAITYILLSLLVLAASFTVFDTPLEEVGSIDKFGNRVLAYEKSAYNPILVTQDPGGVRILSFDRQNQASAQSAFDPQDPDRLVFDYTQAMIKAVCQRDPELDVSERFDIAMLGVGGGSLIRALQRIYPRSNIQGIELDAEVIKVARRWMRLPQGNNIDYKIEDTRQYLSGTDRQFDIIFMDVFNHQVVPSHLLTTEYLQLAAEHLTEDGVLIMNIIGTPNGQFIAQAFASFSRVWPEAKISSDNLAEFDAGSSDNLMMISRSDNITNPCLRDLSSKLDLASSKLIQAHNQVLDIRAAEPYTDQKGVVTPE